MVHRRSRNEVAIKPPTGFIARGVAETQTMFTAPASPIRQRFSRTLQQLFPGSSAAFRC